MEVEVEEQVPVAPILGDDAQLLVSLNHKLSTLGIKDTIKLPTIVVLGDQSTGKSSTVEAISTISVPKASGLCTRCPISLSLSDDGTSRFKCSVYVVEEYDFDPTTRRQRTSNARRSNLGPWTSRLVPTVTHIETTHDRGELIEIIKKAQDKILNPIGKQQSSAQLPTQPETFSPNIIRLELSIPNCAPLHFVDLPGIVASTGKSQPGYYVDLVKSLAAHYCKDENSLLLLALPANHDTSNSNASAAVSEHGSACRTLAVFTKIDICREEERDSILSRYFGEGGEQEEEEYHYGTHIVMLKDTARSIEEVKMAEATFFSKPPWDELKHTTRECLGVSKLSDRISKILIQKTAESLPANLDSILNRAAIIENELKDMPQPPDTTALPYELRAHMSTFDTNMGSLFSQTNECPSSRSTLINSMQKFHRRVVDLSRPTISIKTKAEIKKQKDAQQGLIKEDSGTGSGAGDDERADQSSSTKLETPSSQTRSAASNGPYCFHLERIRQMNKDHYSSSIPGDIELKAVSAMHRLAVDKWDKHFAKFMQEIKHAIKAGVLQCVHNTFSSISHLPAYDRIESIADNYLDHIIKEEHSRLQNLCDSERNHPLTFNDASMRTAEKNSLEYLRKKREEARLDVKKDVQKAEAKGRKCKDLTAADIGLDDFDLEIQMAAKTRAYYEVASHRFVDTVCLNICAQLIPRCEAALASHVRDALGLNNISENKDFLVELMTEDGEREALRRAKVSELERLRTGYNYIANALNTLQGRSSDLPHRPGTFLNYTDPENNFDYYRSVREDPFALRTDISPNKRKIEDADFEDETETFSTPSKRQRETAQRGYQSNSGPSNSRTHLPSRPRSVDPDE